MASVTLKGVKKIYKGGVVAVKNFDLDIMDKEFVVFVGPSGCGKSTTLRMIAGLEDITEGTVYIDGVTVNDLEPKDRDIAMVFQNYALYPHMSVYDNMAFGLTLRRVPKKEIHERVLEAAKILGISDLLARTPRALSGGQRQRVAIGRAIVRIPKVFLMDEPLSNLDAKLRNQMRAEIIQLREKINTTFIYVTHDQTEAMTLGDRIVIMRDGLIQQVGTPEEVFEHPANTFVAGFIGSPQMNFLKVSVIKVNGVQFFEINGSRMKAKPIQDNYKRKEILIGIRPEHVVLSESGALSGEILLLEMMGSELLIHISMKSNEKIIIKVPTHILTEKQKNNLQPHYNIRFNFREDSIHYFDTESGERLNKNQIVDF